MQRGTLYHKQRIKELTREKQALLSKLREVKSEIEEHEKALELSGEANNKSQPRTSTSSNKRRRSIEIASSDSSDEELSRRRRKVPRKAQRVIDDESSDELDGHGNLQDFVVPDNVVELDSDDDLAKVDPPPRKERSVQPKRIDLNGSFNLFVEYLVNCGLDGQFQSRVEAQPSQFPPYLQAAKRIDTAIARIKKSVQEESWKKSMVQSICALPTFKHADKSNLSFCEVCNNTKERAIAQFSVSGKELDPSFYLDVGSGRHCFINVEPRAARYSVSNLCLKKVIYYHTLHHYRYYLIQKIRNIIDNLVNEIGPKSKERILRHVFTSDKPKLFLQGFRVLLNLNEESVKAKFEKRYEEISSYDRMQELIFPERLAKGKTTPKTQSTSVDRSAKEATEIRSSRDASGRQKKKSSTARETEHGSSVNHMNSTVGKDDSAVTTSSSVPSRNSSNKEIDLNLNADDTDDE